MPFPEYQHRIDELYNQYRRNPQMFSPSQIDELEQLADQAGIPFSRRQDEFNLIDNAKQAVSGFVSGMTTLPVGDEPVTTYEKISHSLGHLAGFAPSILGAPMGIISKGLFKAGMPKAAGAITNMSRTAIPVLDKLSVPMIGSRYSKKLIDKALEKSGLDAHDFLKQGAKTRAILNEAVGLGTATTVSNIWAGPDEYMNTFVGGALAGGAFGGIGNFVSIGNRLKFAKTETQRKAAEGALKASLGASVTGIPTALQNEPIESIIYQTLLGGFFGYKSRPAAEAEGGKFFQSLQYGSEPEIQFRPEIHPEWNKFSKKAQDYVNHESTEWARKYLYGLMGPEKADAKVQERAFLNTEKTMGELKEELGNTGDISGKSHDILESMYREYAYKTYKTFDKPSATDIVAYPSAMDDYDKMVQGSREDVTDGAIINPRIVDLYKRMIRTMDRDPNLKMPTKNMDLASIIQASYSETKGMLPSAFIESLRRSDVGRDVTNKFEKDLTAWFHQTNQEMKPAMVADFSGDRAVTYPVLGDFNGKNVGIKTKDFPINKLEPGPDMLLTHVKVRDSKGNVQILQPFDQVKRYNSETKQYEFEPVLTRDMLYKLQADLYNNDIRMMINSGVKDKTPIYISDYHIDTFDGKGLRYTPKDMDGLMDHPKESIMIGDKEVVYDYDKVYNYSLDLMHKMHGVPKVKQGEKPNGKQGLIQEIHDAQWVSNVLKMAESNKIHTPGTDILKEPFHRLKGKTYYKDVIDFNKRRQGDFDRSIPMDPRAFAESTPTGKFRMAFFDDLDPSILNTKLKSATDGSMIIRQDIFDDASNFIGSSSGIAFHKPVIKTKLDNAQSHTYVKSAAKRATDPWDKLMHKHGFHSIVFNSANKHKGDTQRVAWKYKDGEYTIDQPLKTDKYNRKYEIPIQDLRISMTTAEHPRKSVGFQYAPIQLSEMLNFEQSGKAAKLFAKEIIDPSINGEVEINNLFKNIKNESEILKKLSSDKHFIDKMDVELIHKMLVDHPDSKITKAIRKQVMKLEREQLSDDIFIEQDLEDITYRNTTILKNADANWSSSHFNKYSKFHFEKAYDRYMMKRLRNPKIKESAKVILSPVELDVFDSANITNKGVPIREGEIILGKALRRMPVKDEKYKNLGEMFDAGKAVELVVIRVPADSISGARVLKLRGFTKEGGTGAVTHPKDDAYLGGADKDIDSAFIFEGFSKKLKDAYKKHSKEWENEKGEFRDSKPERDDDLFAVGKKLSREDWLKLKEIEGHYKTSTSRFSPSMRIQVARNSRKGNKAIGFSVVAKKKIYDIYNYELERGNIGKEITKVFDIKNKEAVLRYTPTKESGTRLRDLGRQALNRSADAANYPMFVSMDKIPDILTSEAFKNATVTIGGKTRAATSKDFFNAYKNNIASIDAINPNKRNYAEGERKILFNERQVLMNDIDPTFENNSIWGELNKRVAAKGLGRDYRAGRIENILDRVLEGGLEGVAKMEIPRKVTGSMYDHITKLFDVQVQINSTALKRAKGEQAYEMLYNDLDQVAGRNSIVRAFEDVLSTIKNPNNVEMWTKADAVALKALNDIVKGAMKTKAHIINMRKSDAPQEVGKSIAETMDSFIRARKSRISGALLPLKIDPRPFMKLYETILLSPFRVTGQARPEGILKARQLASPWTSKFISDASKKSYLNEFDNVVKLIEGPSEVSKETMAKVIYKPTKEFAKLADFATKLRYKAIRPDHIQEVENLEQIIKRYPEEARNMEEFFESWQAATRGVVKDISQINKNDLKAFNKFLRGESPEELNRWIYYKDPSQVSKEMLKHDRLVFDSYHQPVMTKDGIVKKTVKRMTSTMGALKDWFHKADNEKQFHIDKSIKGNANALEFRRIQSIKDRDDINRLVIRLRESRRPEVDSKLLQPEIEQLRESLSKKYKNLDHLVDQADRTYTKIFKEFGEEWIYAGNQRDKYIKKNKDGSLDLGYFIKQIENAYSGKKFPIIPLEIQLEVFYNMTVDKLAARSRNPAKFRSDYLDKKSHKWNIGEEQVENYWHKRYGTTDSDLKAIEKYIETEMQKAYQIKFKETNDVNKATAAAKGVEEAHKSFFERSRSNTGGVEDNVLDAIVSNFDYHTLRPKDIASRLENIGFFGRPNSVLERRLDLPLGYDTKPESFDMYMTQVINSNYKNLAAIVSDYRITDFMKRAPMDKGMDGKPIKLTAKRRKELEDASSGDFRYRNNSDVYADYLRLYLRDYMGYQTTFPERIINSMSSSDPLKLKKNLYYGFSDQAAIKYLDKLNKRWNKVFKKNLPFLKDLPEGTSDSAMKERAKVYSRLLKAMTRNEARYELLTLLANTGSMTANIFGGSSNIIGSAGLRNFTRANSNSWLKKNLLVDRKGNYNIKLSDGTVVDSKAKLRDWVAEKGVLDTMIRDEFEYNPDMIKIKKKLGLNFKEFMSQFSSILRNNKATDMTYKELFKKYNVLDEVTKKGAWFMNASERYLRATAFTSHAIRARNRFGKDAVDLPLDDPYIVQAGLDGIEATQFLYNAQSRPAFMRSSIGRMMSRFKLFAFKSVRLRKEFYKNAKASGF